MIDIRNRDNWKNNEKFLNIVFITGFIKHLKKNDQVSFDIQQSKNQVYFKVIVCNNLKINIKRFADDNPIKIIARVEQNPSLDYSSLILVPLKFSRPAVNEICADNLKTLLQLDDIEAKIREKDNVNLVHVSGFVYSKALVDNKSKIMFLLWNSKNGLIPVIINNLEKLKNIRQFMPVYVVGSLIFTNVNKHPQICVEAKEVKITIGGDDIPESEPDWLSQFKLNFASKN